MVQYYYSITDVFKLTFPLVTRSLWRQCLSHINPTIVQIVNKKTNSYIAIYTTEKFELHHNYIIITSYWLIHYTHHILSVSVIEEILIITINFIIICRNWIFNQNDYLTKPSQCNRKLFMTKACAEILLTVLNILMMIQDIFFNVLNIISKLLWNQQHFISAWMPSLTFSLKSLDDNARVLVIVGCKASENSALYLFILWSV